MLIRVFSSSEGKDNIIFDANFQGVKELYLLLILFWNNGYTVSLRKIEEKNVEES